MTSHGRLLYTANTGVQDQAQEFNVGSKNLYPLSHLNGLLFLVLVSSIFLCLVCQLVCRSIYISDTVSCSPGWTSTHYVAKDNLLWFLRLSSGSLAFVFWLPALLWTTPSILTPSARQYPHSGAWWVLILSSVALVTDSSL